MLLGLDIRKTSQGKRYAVLNALLLEAMREPGHTTTLFKLLYYANVVSRIVALLDQCDVLIAIPHSGLAVNLEWSISFASLWKHAPPHTKLFLMPEPQIDVARNKAVAAALQVGAKHVFFLDSDIHAPNDAIARLLSRRLPIVSGLYGRRQKGPRNQMFRRQGGILTPIEAGMYEPGSVVECDAIGLGCVLVDAEALRRIGAPWFQWMEGYVMGGESEDFEFCRKAVDAGFKISVDTSIICRHSGLIKWLPPSKDGNVFEYSQTTGMFSD